MRRSLVAAAAVVALALSARADFREFKAIPVDPSMATRIRHASDEVFKRYPKLKPEDLAISLVDLTPGERVGRADLNGDAPFYPASVIKLFFLTATYAEHKENVPDVQRALKEMIVVSDNDATAYIVDVLSGTAAGPELQGRPLKKFVDARRVVNRFFESKGYDISAMMKPWSFGPFGRELQLIGPNRENRNRATANSIASLMLWIAQGRAVSPAASDAMKAFLERPLEPLRPEENQVKEFIGEALPKGSRLWSKAGWTTEVRHDAALIELPDGHKYVMVIMTRGQADDLTIVPGIARALLDELAR
jgi:beta-lactamase class A